jgi:hypothetical protein
MVEDYNTIKDISANQSESLEDEFISLKKLARILGIHHTNARSFVKKLGINLHKRRTLDSRNQLTDAITKIEAEFVINKRQEQGFFGGKTIAADRGSFYAIQLVPEISPKRIKLGFAISVSERLQQHRTAAPTAKLIKSWPCKKVWELTAMDCVTQKGCRLIANEVFECDDLDTLISLGDKFFQILPTPKYQIPFDDASPLKSQKKVTG